jgi:isopentenyl diphosphate isomerase/L-lactate dehydrogenase-like FMN-dependent dehydrogenase
MAVLLLTEASPLAVGDQTYIMYDSGVRGAADVLKALALGAKFVFIGRLWVWGLSIMGEHGVRHVMKSLLADLDILMNVAGYPDLNKLDRTALGERLPSWRVSAQHLRIYQSHTQEHTVYWPRSLNCRPPRYKHKTRPA